MLARLEHIGLNGERFILASQLLGGFKIVVNVLPFAVGLDDRCHLGITLAVLLGKPLIGVNCRIGHLEFEVGMLSHESFDGFEHVSSCFLAS